MADSILSTEEREVAAALRDGDDVATIAAARDEPESVVERAVERVREKTERAFATLAESPFAAEAASELSATDRDRILAAIRESDET